MNAFSTFAITKRYRIGVGRARVREMMPWPIDSLLEHSFPTWWSANTFEALREVSLSVAKGSSVGIIGHNGAGKTTLLRLIAGITSPTSGSLEVNGRVAALIDVLVGFHPELTGRENAYLLGAIYGIGRREMARRMSDILAFAEIEDLVDTPLKRYSAGMGARLGFGTITVLDPEILLIDEVLAVGDAAFQRKCIDWLAEYRDRGNTLVFVSHNLSMMRSMTQRAVWLDHGQVAADGPTSDVVTEYAKAAEKRHDTHAGATKRQIRKALGSKGADRWGAGGVRVSHVGLGESVSRDNGVHVTISYETKDMTTAVFCVGFADETGRDVCASSSLPLALRSGGGEVTCVIRPLPLRVGVYFPTVAIVSPDGLVCDRWRLERAVFVEGNGDEGRAHDLGPVELNAKWA